MPLTSQRFLLRTLADGRRQVSWRVWVLIWVAPVLFVGAAVLLSLEAAYKLSATVPGEGEVVRVYAWPGETWFDRGKTNYSPVFRYQWTDGTMTEASSGVSHPDWNFAIGERHAIRYFPGAKRDVVLPGPHNWFVARVIAIIGGALVFPAALASLAVWRWQRRGTHEGGAADRMARAAGAGGLGRTRLSGRRRRAGGAGLRHLPVGLARLDRNRPRYQPAAYPGARVLRTR